MNSVFGDLSDKFEIVQHEALGMNLTALKSNISDYLHCDYYTLCSKVADIVERYNLIQKSMSTFQRGTYRIVSFYKTEEKEYLAITQESSKGEKVLFSIKKIEQ